MMLRFFFRSGIEQERRLLPFALESDRKASQIPEIGTEPIEVPLDNPAAVDDEKESLVTEADQATHEAQLRMDNLLANLDLKPQQKEPEQKPFSLGEALNDPSLGYIALRPDVVALMNKAKEQGATFTIEQGSYEGAMKILNITTPSSARTESIPLPKADDPDPERVGKHVSVSIQMALENVGVEQEKPAAKTAAILVDPSIMKGLEKYEYRDAANTITASLNELYDAISSKNVMMQSAMNDIPSTPDRVGERKILAQRIKQYNELQSSISRQLSQLIYSTGESVAKAYNVLVDAMKEFNASEKYEFRSEHYIQAVAAMGQVKGVDIASQQGTLGEVIGDASLNSITLTPETQALISKIRSKGYRLSIGEKGLMTVAPEAFNGNPFTPQVRVDIPVSKEATEQGVRAALETFIARIETSDNPKRVLIEQQLAQYQEVTAAGNLGLFAEHANEGALALLPRAKGERAFADFFKQNRPDFVALYGEEQTQKIEERSQRNLSHLYDVVIARFDRRQINKQGATVESSDKELQLAYQHSQADVMLLSLIVGNDPSAPAELHQRLEQEQAKLAVLETRLGLRKEYGAFIRPALDEASGFELLEQYDAADRRSMSFVLPDDPTVIPGSADCVGYLPVLEKLILQTKGNWTHDEAEARVVQFVIGMVESNLEPLSYYLEHAPHEVKNTQAYLQMSQVYARKAEVLARITGALSEKYESSYATNPERAAEWVGEAMKYMPLQQSIAFASDMMQATEENDMQSGSVKEAYMSVATACKTHLQSKLDALKKESESDPSKREEYLASAMQIAELFTGRSTYGIDNALKDPTFASTVLEGVVGFDKIATQRMGENPMQKQLAPERLQKVIALVPDDMKSHPDLQPMLKVLQSQPADVHGQIEQYTIMRQVESLASNNPVDVQGEVERIMGNYILRAQETLHQHFDESGEAPVGLPPDAQKAWDLLADIQGYGSLNHSDQTLSTIENASKVGAVILAGVLAGMATGGAGFSLLATVLVGGAATTAANKLIFQEGFDSLEDFRDTYGTEFVINGVSMGLGNVFQAARIIRHMKLAGTYTDELGAQIIRMATFGAKESNLARMGLSSLDDLAAIGAKVGRTGMIMDDLAEGVTDAVASSAIESQLNGASFLENMAQNMWFLGLVSARHLGPAFMDGLKNATSNHVAQLKRIVAESDALVSKIRERGWTAEDISIMTKRVESGNTVTSSAGMNAEDVFLLKAKIEIDARMDKLINEIVESNRLAAQGASPSEGSGILTPEQNAALENPRLREDVPSNPAQNNAPSGPSVATIEQPAPSTVARQSVPRNTTDAPSPSSNPDVAPPPRQQGAPNAPRDQAPAPRNRAPNVPPPAPGTPDRYGRVIPDSRFLKPGVHVWVNQAEFIYEGVGPDGKQWMYRESDGKKFQSKRSQIRVDGREFEAWRVSFTAAGDSAARPQAGNSVTETRQVPSTRTQQRDAAPNTERTADADRTNPQQRVDAESPAVRVETPEERVAATKAKELIAAQRAGTLDFMGRPIEWGSEMDRYPTVLAKDNDGLMYLWLVMKNDSDHVVLQRSAPGIREKQMKLMKGSDDFIGHQVQTYNPPEFKVGDKVRSPNFNSGSRTDNTGVIKSVAPDGTILYTSDSTGLTVETWRNSLLPYSTVDNIVL